MKIVFGIPLIVHQFLDTSGEYSFGIDLSAESVTFQIDLWADPSDITNMDAMYQAVKTIMNGLDYMNINSGIELIDTDITKVVRPTRWERYNV